MSTRRSTRGTRSTRSSAPPSPQPAAPTRASRRSSRRGGSEQTPAPAGSRSTRRKRGRAAASGAEDGGGDEGGEEEDAKMKDGGASENEKEVDNDEDGDSGKKPAKRAKVEKAEGADGEVGKGEAEVVQSSSSSGVTAAGVSAQPGAAPDQMSQEARLAKKKEKCAEWAALLAKGLPQPKSLREALIEFYRVHNQEKLATINMVTDHYNVYGDINLWKTTNDMHTAKYKNSTVDMRLDRMFADINTHYGVPSADGTILGARPRKPDMRTLAERLSDATLTSAKPGGGKTPVALKRGAPVWAHILSFHNFCEYPTHIFGGGAHRKRDFGKIVHPELELRLLCRGMYRALRTPRAVQVPGCGPWQRLTLEAGVRLVKSMRTFKQMPVPRSSDPAVAAQQNSRTPTHKPIEPGFWGPKTEVSSLGHRKIWERKFVTVSEIQLGAGRFQCSTRKENRELGYTYTGWGIDFSDLTISGKGRALTLLVGQFGVKAGARNVTLRDLTITSPKRDGLVVCGGAVVSVTNCVITGCGGDGVSVHMGGRQGGSKVAMKNCRVNHNVRYGIDVQGEGASADLMNVITHHNGMTGLIVCNGAHCDLRGHTSASHSNGVYWFSHRIGCGIYVEGPQSITRIHLPADLKLENRGENKAVDLRLTRDNAVKDLETIVDGKITRVSLTPEAASEFVASQKELVDNYERTEQRCLQQGFARIPEDFRTLQDAARLCKKSEGKCLEIRVSSGRYRTADDIRTTTKDLELATLAAAGEVAAGSAATGAAAAGSASGDTAVAPAVANAIQVQGSGTAGAGATPAATTTAAVAAAAKSNKYTKYISVSNQSIQKDVFSPRLMIDFSGLRIVGAGAGGFADPYPDRVGPGKPFPGSFGMLEQGGGSGETTVIGGIEVTGAGVKDVVVEGLTMQQVGFHVSDGASATIRNCEVNSCRRVGTSAGGSGSRMSVENCRIHRNLYYGVESRGAGCEVEVSDTVCYENMRSGMRAAEGGVLHMRGEKTHIGRNRHSGLYASGAGSKIHIHLPQSLNIVHNNGGNGGSSQRGAAGGGAGAGAEKTDDAKSNVLQEDSGEVVYEAGS